MFTTGHPRPQPTPQRLPALVCISVPVIHGILSSRSIRSYVLTIRCSHALPIAYPSVRHLFMLHLASPDILWLLIANSSVSLASSCSWSAHPWLLYIPFRSRPFQSLPRLLIQLFHSVVRLCAIFFVASFDPSVHLRSLHATSAMRGLFLSLPLNCQSSPTVPPQSVFTFLGPHISWFSPSAFIIL